MGIEFMKKRIMDTIKLKWFTLKFRQNERLKAGVALTHLSFKKTFYIPVIVK